MLVTERSRGSAAARGGGGGKEEEAIDAGSRSKEQPVPWKTNRLEISNRQQT